MKNLLLSAAMAAAGFGVFVGIANALPQMPDLSAPSQGELTQLVSDVQAAEPTQFVSVSHDHPSATGYRLVVTDLWRPDGLVQGLIQGDLGERTLSQRGLTLKVMHTTAASSRGSATRGGYADYSVSVGTEDKPTMAFLRNGRCEGSLATEDTCSLLPQSDWQRLHDTAVGLANQQSGVIV